MFFGGRRGRLVRNESRDLCEVNREPCLNHKLIINQIMFRVSKRVNKCEVTPGERKKLNPAQNRDLVNGIRLHSREGGFCLHPPNNQAASPNAEHS